MSLLGPGASIYTVDKITSSSIAVKAATFLIFPVGFLLLPSSSFSGLHFQMEQDF